MRVALVHDWLTGMRGGEKVLEAICELYPEAPLYSLVRVPGAVTPRLERRRLVTSFVQRLPWAGRLYRQYLPLFPAAVELFDLDGYDLVISTSHCAVKSVVRPGRAVHVSYCHSPMRYAWDQFDQYFGEAQVGRLRSRIARPVMASLARWDRATAGRVDRFVANSRYVAGRIRRYYNRESTVVYPPVDTDFYRPSVDRSRTRSGFLVVSALVPYKRVDLAIEASRRVGVPLTIVGTGPDLARLQAGAGSHVTFAGWRSNEEIRDLYQHSAAVILPGVEDFGIVPVEAQACGCPVVALGEGGAAETVIDEVTGVLVGEPSADAFAEGLDRVRSLTVEPEALHQHTQQFSREAFLEGFQAVIRDAAKVSSPRQQAAREEDPGAARMPPPQQQAAREEDPGAARMPPPQQQAAREEEQ